MSQSAWQIFTEYPNLYHVSPISHLCLSSARAETMLRWAAWYMNDNEDDGNNNHPSLTHSSLSVSFGFFLVNVAEDEILSSTDFICRLGLCHPPRDSFLICISERHIHLIQINHLLHLSKSIITYLYYLSIHTITKLIQSSTADGPQSHAFLCSYIWIYWNASVHTQTQMHLGLSDTQSQSKRIY